MLLRKGNYPYERIDSRERFDETILANKKAFYRELKLEDITDKDYIHAQKVFEEFKFKKLGGYHDLQMYLKTLETSVLKYMSLIVLFFCLHLD